MNLIIAAVLTGAGGAFTPCTLGVNLAVSQMFTKYKKGKRIINWILFAVTRALFLTILGLVIGIAGKIITDFTWWFQMIINIAVIILGILFILGSRKPLLPGLDLGGHRRLTNGMSSVAMGAVFGLNITACIAPLVLALLARTIVNGNWISGAAALFIFGIMLSLPILVTVFSERASTWIIKMSGKYRKVYYWIVGGSLIVLGLVEIIFSLYVIPFVQG